MHTSQGCFKVHMKQPSKETLQVQTIDMLKGSIVGVKSISFPWDNLIGQKTAVIMKQKEENNLAAT